VVDEITLEVTSALDGERVDKALAVLLGISRTDSRLLVEQGVLLDGAPTKPRDRVKAGSSLVSPRPFSVAELEPEPVGFGVLYEDEFVVVVDKPAGLVVHPGSGRSKGTLAAGLLFRYPDLKGVGTADRWGLVHRLDKETSGALVVGKTETAYESLVLQLRRRDITRSYRALVDGKMGSPTGTVDAPIGRDPGRPTRRAVVAGGKHARTHYEVDVEYADMGCTLLNVRLETGRTHQIRVHLSAIDHPVIGDRVYGRRPTQASSPRTFLHASEVSFSHPNTGDHIVVTSQLPEDLRAVLEGLGALGSY
jgi:23S rRNA pseudouridine1911/1915/1917 synthase